MNSGEFVFACPICRTPLEALAPHELHCPTDGTHYWRVDGIWRLMAPERQSAFQQFIHEYETIRRAEGRGSHESSYYRMLPFHDASGRYADDWRVRAKSYRVLTRQALWQIELRQDRALRVLDLGAGNGWLSYRLALRGHQLAAVDLLTNSLDGLGAQGHYDVGFTAVQAEFDHLPFASDQVDVAIFNGSLHYSTQYEATLAEALRVLRQDGILVIMDTPIYRNGTSGRQMVQEREAHFQRTYGYPSNAVASENYLTYARLDEMAATLGLHWQCIEPWYGVRWAVRPWKARLRGHREPARFLVIVGIRDGAHAS